MSMPLRTKLLFSFVLVVAVTGCVITAVGIKIMDSAAARQAESKADHALEVALQLYGRHLEEIRTALAFTAIRPVTVRRALLQRDLQTLAESLSKVRAECKIDVLSITDADGRVVLRSQNAAVAGDDVSDDDLVAAVLERKEPLAATQIWTTLRLQKECPGLVPPSRPETTDEKWPSGRNDESGALLVLAAAPVLTDGGEVAGVLYGGSLLDRECERREQSMVDHMSSTVFRNEKEPGAVAILRGNAVVSTSLLNDGGGRMLGPLGREDIERAVLREGRRWRGRYEAGHEWYIAASAPLRDLDGTIVGMLHVGVPEKEYTMLRRKTVIIFSTVTVAGMIIAVGISFALAAGILRPLRELSTGVSQVSRGNLDYRLTVNSRGPLGKLAEAFNRMADSIKERDDRIKRDAREMVEGKRLATLGQLAAGVAHEINNPLGGITVYAHLLLEDLPSGEACAGNVRKIINEAERCKKIVKGLLDYSRQSGLHKEPTDINSVLNAAVTLATQQKEFSNVAVNRHLASDLPPVEVDLSQIEEVFTNILLNAAEAMQCEGEITITTSRTADRVVVKISDNGPGIPPDAIDRIFDPFFTSKETGHGMGLGLAISYGIVENHGGTVRAENIPTGGATFAVELPLNEEQRT